MSDYCGCCGREITADDLPGMPLWCDDCRPHLAASPHLWDRTWFAQHGTECPFQVGRP